MENQGCHDQDGEVVDKWFGWGVIHRGVGVVDIGWGRCFGFSLGRYSMLLWANWHQTAVLGMAVVVRGVDSWAYVH